LICNTGHRVHAGQSHSHVGVSQLLGGGTETFNEPALFKVPLPPVRHNKGNHSADASSDS
jgi:hypothetical protein